jgi:trimeric autotransporter adhesin
VDTAGDLYIAEAIGRRVRMVAQDGTIITVAGNGLPYSVTGTGDGGPATSAVVTQPTGVAVDSSGNLYIADSFNNRIREVSPDGTITTVAGGGSGSYSGDGGPATSAGLNQPGGVAVDAAGNLYIADTGDQRIRLVTPDGMITTIAGNGQLNTQAGTSGDGGPATSASLTNPNGVAVGSLGVIYISEDEGIRMLTPAGP